MPPVNPNGEQRRRKSTRRKQVSTLGEPVIPMGEEFVTASSQDAEVINTHSADQPQDVSGSESWNDYQTTMLNGAISCSEEYLEYSERKKIRAVQSGYQGPLKKDSEELHLHHPSMEIAGDQVKDSDTRQLPVAKQTSQSNTSKHNLWQRHVSNITIRHTIAAMLVALTCILAILSVFFPTGMVVMEKIQPLTLFVLGSLFPIVGKSNPSTTT